MAALPSLASAQTMYCCGNAFSQKPCGDGAPAVKVPGTQVASGAGTSPPGNRLLAGAAGQRELPRRFARNRRTDTVAYA